MSAPGPRGARPWLILAGPLVAWFAFVAIGAGALRAAGVLDDGDVALTNLPAALLLLAGYAVFLGAILLAARALGVPRDVLAVRRVPLLRGAALAGAGVLAGLGAAAVLEPIFHGQASQPIVAGDVTGVGTALALAISIASLAGAAPLCEELYFRGILYGRLDARFGTASAIVGSAGVFGLAHFEPNAFPALFALGLILGVLRWRSSSVWPGVAMHAANNVLATAALLLAAG